MKPLEAVLEVVGELVPGGGVAAVLDEGADVGREVVAAHHHRGGRAHGHAVHDGEVVLEDVVGDRGPVFHVQAVEPAHLGGLALGVAEELEVRDHHVIVELVAVHAHEVHEDKVVVGVAVDDDGGTLGRGGILGGGVDGVQLVAVRVRAGDVLEDALGVQVVVPGHHAGGEGVGLGAGALDVGLAVLGGLEGVVGHEFAGEAAREAVRGEEERGAPKEDAFQCHSLCVVAISGNRWRRTGPATPGA